MVSPFMSFATGALGAVNNQINKYQQTQAAEKLAEQEEERAFNRLEFDRATQLSVVEKTNEGRIEAEKLKQKANRAKNYSSAGGFEWLKGASERERVVNPLTAFVSEPEKFKAAYERCKDGSRA